MKKVIIIGAGVGGLATANLLQKAGYSVHVYEKEKIPGGRAGQFTSKGFTFDTGPSWYLMPDVFEHYYNLLGTTTDEQLELVKLSPAYKVFFEQGSPITIHGNLDEDAKTFEAIEQGSGAALRKYVTKANTTYRLALKHFLYSNFTATKNLTHGEIVRRAGEMLKLALMPIDRYVSSFVTNQRLKQVLEYPMVFLGSSPYNAPALYSLMSALDFKEGVFYPKGTMYAVIESLHAIGKDLGVTYHFGADVRAIETDGTRATGITLQNGKKSTADIVISNADLHFTETTLLPESVRSYPARYWSKKEPSPSALLLYLGIEGKVPEFEHHTLLFVEDWKANFDAIYKTKTMPKKASLYISKTSHTDPETASKGNENIFVLVPLPAGVTVSEKEVERLSAHYLEQIKVMTGVDLASRIITKTHFGPNDFKTKYNSWQSSMLGPSHKLWQSAFFRTPNKSKKLSNLYYVGAGTVPGVGVPMCLISAELIYKRLAGDATAEPLSELALLAKEEAK